MENGNNNLDNPAFMFEFTNRFGYELGSVHKKDKKLCRIEFPLCLCNFFFLYF